VEAIRGSVTREERIPVKVVPTKKVATGFSLTSTNLNTATDSQPAKQGYFVLFKCLKFAYDIKILLSNK
jgi:hypothetical protein